jgi:hypothetical protein
MVHPTQEVISRGVKTVLKWCAMRLQSSKANRWDNQAFRCTAVDCSLSNRGVGLRSYTSTS